MSEKTLKRDNIRANEKKFINLNNQSILISVDKIVISDKFKHSDMVLSILLVTKKVKLLNRYILSYLK